MSDNNNYELYEAYYKAVKAYYEALYAYYKYYNVEDGPQGNDPPHDHTH